MGWKIVLAIVLPICIFNLLLAPVPQRESTAWAVTETASTQCQNPNCVCDPCRCEECDCKAPVREDKALQSKPTIYFFTRSDCVYCPPMKPLANQLHRDGHTVYVVDESRQDLVSKYGVTAYPTFLVVDGEKIVRRVIGLTDANAVLGKINQPLPASSTSQVISDPVYQRPSYQVQRPQRSGWFRARSACGAGGCK